MNPRAICFEVAHKVTRGMLFCFAVEMSEFDSLIIALDLQVI